MSASYSAGTESGRANDIALSGRVLRLRDPDRMIREEAAAELAGNPDSTAPYELCRLLADQDISVRNLVAEVLVRLGKSASQALIDEASSPDHDVRKFVVDIMASIKERGFTQVLIRLLNDPNENVVGSAAEALGQVAGDEAVEALVNCINTHSASIPQAIEALGRIGSPEALPILFELLESNNNLWAYAAVEAIGNIESAEAIDKLLELISVDDHLLRDVILTTILKIAGPANRDKIYKATEGKFIDYLIEASASDDIAIKKAAVNELAFWSGEKVVAALVERLDDNDDEVTDLARGALRLAGATGLNAFIEGVISGSDKAKIHLVEISAFLKSPELHEVILDQVLSANPDIRLATALTLNRYSGDKTTQALLTLADDPIGHIRTQALKSLGLVANHTIIGEIWKHLDDEYADVREACLGTLVLIGGEQAIRRFEEDIKSSNIKRKIMAVKGLGWIGEDRAIRILLDSLNHEDAEVRRNAVIGLAKMNCPELEDKLTLLLADENPEVRKAVVDAYVALLGNRAGDKIIVLLDDQDMWVRFYAINALGSIEDVSCLEKLMEIMDDQPPFIQIAIIHIIAGCRNSEAGNTLLRLADSDNDDIANAAREALDNRRSE